MFLCMFDYVHDNSKVMYRNIYDFFFMWVGLGHRKKRLNFGKDPGYFLDTKKK